MRIKVSNNDLSLQAINLLLQRVPLGGQGGDLLA